MAQVLVAIYRITIRYTVDGFTHIWRGYCEVDDDTIVTPNLIDRSGGNTISWVDAAQDVWDAFRGTLPNTTIGASALLEKRTGIIWNPLGAVSVTGDGGTAGTKPASQLTLVLRDTAFKKLRFVVMEQALGYIGHSVSGRGIYSEIDNIIDSLDGTSSGLAKEYLWLKSRGDRFLLAAGMVAGGTLDLNDKIKRARGLE